MVVSGQPFQPSGSWKDERAVDSYQWPFKLKTVCRYTLYLEVRLSIEGFPLLSLQVSTSSMGVSWMPLHHYSCPSQPKNNERTYIHGKCFFSPIHSRFAVLRNKSNSFFLILHLFGTPCLVHLSLHPIIYMYTVLKGIISIPTFSSPEWFSS